jgi:hypothetical protein
MAVVDNGIKRGGCPFFGEKMTGQVIAHRGCPRKKQRSHCIQSLIGQIFRFMPGAIEKMLEADTTFRMNGQKP